MGGGGVICLYVKNELPLLLNHERTAINHFILEIQILTSHTQAWLLPDLLNQEIT